MLKQWLHKQRDYMRKTAGLAEKHTATQKKIDVATKILNRRHHVEPVEVERRSPRMTMLDSEFTRVKEA